MTVEQERIYIDNMFEANSSRGSSERRLVRVLDVGSNEERFREKGINPDVIRKILEGIPVASDETYEELIEELFHEKELSEFPKSAIVFQRPKALQSDVDDAMYDFDLIVVGGDRIPYSTERFAQEVDTLRPALVAFAARIGAADPENVVGTAMLKALKGLSGVKDELIIKPWMYRIVLNEVRDRLRRNAVRGGMVSLEAYIGDGSVDHTLAIEDRSETANPESHFFRNHSEERDKVYSNLLKLSPLERLSLVLTYYAEMDSSVIAEIMGVSKQSVKTRNMRGRNKIKANM